MTAVFLVLLLAALVAGFCGFLVWRIRRFEGRQAPRLEQLNGDWDSPSTAEPSPAPIVGWGFTTAEARRTVRREVPQ